MRIVLLAFLAASGCASPGREVTRQPGDFAFIEFALRDCTSNDQHLGLAKFLEDLFKTTPQIDLDRQLARIRVPSPASLDFPGIADGFRRSNTGLDRVHLTCVTTVLDGRLVLHPTRQTFRIDRTVPDNSTLKLRRFQVIGWGFEQRLSVVLEE